MFPPFGWEGEPDGRRRDNFFDLEGTVVFVVQLPRGSLCFNMATVEHYEVSDLVSWGWCSGFIGVFDHPFFGCFEGLQVVLKGVFHPMSINVGSGVEYVRLPGI